MCDIVKWWRLTSLWNPFPLVGLKAVPLRTALKPLYFVKLKWEWIFAHLMSERACVCVCVRGNRERAQIKRITDTNDYNTELLLPIFFSIPSPSPSSSLFIRSLFSSYFQSCFYISITWSDYFTYRVFIANICHIFNRRGKTEISVEF